MLKKSVKPQSSSQNWKKISAVLSAVSGLTANPTADEEKFTLLSHRAEEEPQISMSSGDGARVPHAPPRIGGGGGSGSFDFRNREEEDPPSKLIGEFLHKQRASGDFSLDVDLDPEARSSVSPENRTRNPSEEAPRRSSTSFQRRSSLTRTKTTRSRLIDPPEHPDPIRSGHIARSGQLRSGFLGRVVDDDEDDLSLGEDIPEDYKKETLSFWVLIEFLSLILFIATLICTITIKKLRKIQKLDLPLWKWEFLVLALICGRLVSNWIIRILVFFVERNFLLRKRVLYFVYGIKKAVQNCLWLGLVLIAWHFLFDKDVERRTNQEVLGYVSKLLLCFLVGVMLWLVKTLVIKVLASSFHVSTYFDRIQDSLFNQYVIEVLSGPPLVEIKKIEAEEERFAGVGAAMALDLKASAPKICRAVSKRGGDEGITIDHLHKLNPTNVSAWNMKRLVRIVRHGVLSTMDERILGSTAQEDESATQIRSENEAKAAARKIFYNVAKPGSKCIFLEDLMRFLQDDEASKTMILFEGAPETQKITKSALRNWVVNAFRERRALALSLNDTKTAVNKLHQMVNALVGIIILVISLLILGIASSKLLVFISSQLLLVAFIFGNTCKTVFEAIIFLFVMHPFDVGDRCEIEGVQMVVEEMNILSTVFLRFDNQKIVYPNSVLATKAISNYYRSPDMGDAVEFCVHVSTPAEKIAAMKQRITSFVDNKKEHWYSTPMIIFKDVEELNKVRIAVWLTHRMNHQDMGEKWNRRASLVEEMVKMFKELDVQFRLLPLDVNVCSVAAPATTSARQPATWNAPAG